MASGSILPAPGRQWNDEGEGGSPVLVLEDCTEEALPPPADEDGRKAAFQTMYSTEISRQENLLNLRQEGGHYSSPPKGGGGHGASAGSAGSAQITGTPESEITWEDG